MSSRLDDAGEFNRSTSTGQATGFYYVKARPRAISSSTSTLELPKVRADVGLQVRDGHRDARRVEYTAIERGEGRLEGCDPGWHRLLEYRPLGHRLGNRPRLAVLYRPWSSCCLEVTERDAGRRMSIACA